MAELGALLLFVAVSLSHGISVLVVALLCLAAFGYLWHRKNGSAFPFFFGIFLATALFTYPIYGGDRGTESIYQFLPALTWPDRLAVIRVGLMLACGYAIGAGCASRKQGVVNASSPVRSAPVQVLSHLGGADWPGRAALLSPILLIVGRGVSNLLERDSYIVFPANKAVLLVGTILLVPSFLAAAARAWAGKKDSLLFALILGFFAFSAASRLLVAVAVLVVLFLTRQRTQKATFVALVFLAPLALSLTLFLRASDGPHGLLAYSAAVTDDPGAALSDRLPDVLGNLFVGFALTPVSAIETLEVSQDAVLWSADPRPGSHGYAKIESELALVSFEGGATFPHNGLGILAAAGPEYLLAVGLVIGLSERAAGSIAELEKARRLSLGFAIVWIYSISQYSLRQSFRLASVLLIGWLVVYLARSAKAAGSQVRLRSAIGQKSGGGGR